MRYLSPILVILSAPLGLFPLGSPANFNFDPTQAANSASFPKPPDTKSSIPDENSPHDVIASTFQTTLSRPLIDLLSSSKITPWPEFSFRLGNVAFQLVAFVDAASSYLRSNGKENDAQFFDRVKDSISRLISKHPSSPASPQLPPPAAPVPPATPAPAPASAPHPPEGGPKPAPVPPSPSPSGLKPEEPVTGTTQETTTPAQPPAISTTPLPPPGEQTGSTATSENSQKTESEKEKNEKAATAGEENSPNAGSASDGGNDAGAGSEVNSGNGDENSQQNAPNQNEKEEAKDESPFGDAFSM